ncbi:MAG: hypothetical protein GF308_16015 [Candidatus Heimdallarchaeota archaeon]|nr:hypothetical protein [Candidatus Heimdallarchaeota archaeon]
MFWKRIHLKLRTPAMFTKSFYKRHAFIEYHSFDWIPQSTLFGALSAAINRIYKKPLEVLDKIHLTSATPTCSICNSPTYFHIPDSPFCEEHGMTKPKRVMLIHSISLDPIRWQTHMLNEGKLVSNKRMNPRKFFALRPK